MNKKMLFKLAGYLLGGFAFYYIFIQIRDSGISWDQVSNSIQGFDLAWLLLATILYLIVMYIGAVIWVYLVNLISFRPIRKNLSKMILVHSKSNIGKYLPGNFMQFVGRNVLANKLGYSHTNIILSTLFEIIFSIVIGVFIIVLLVVPGFVVVSFDKIELFTKNQSIYMLMFLLLASIFFMAFKSKVISLVGKYKILLNNKTAMFRVIFGFILAYLIMGLCNLIIFYVLNNKIEYSDYINFLVIYLISWILGFILPGPPGGLGVREAIYISFLSASYDLAIITLTALILRVVNILGDVLYLFISAIIIDNNKDLETI